MKINTNDPIILGRIIPDSGKIHQNQEVLSIYGGGITLKACHYKSPPMICVEESKNEIEVLTDLGVGGQRGRVFNPNGIVGALSATDYKGAEKVLVKEEDSNE